MTRGLLALLLALAPAAAGAQEDGLAQGAPEKAGPPAAPAPEKADPVPGLVAEPRPPEGQFAHPPPAELGGAPQRLVVTTGLTLLGGSGTGPLLGGTLGLSLVRERWAMVESLEVARGETLVLFGGGRILPLPGRFHALLAGLGGLHATGDPVAFLPAVGVRAEMGWTTQPSRAILDYVNVSLTALGDLVRTENGAGDPVGGFRFALGVNAGFVLERGGRAR